MGRHGSLGSAAADAGAATERAAAKPHAEPAVRPAGARGAVLAQGAHGVGPAGRRCYSTSLPALSALGFR